MTRLAFALVCLLSKAQAFVPGPCLSGGTIRVQARSAHSVATSTCTGWPGALTRAGGALSSRRSETRCVRSAARWPRRRSDAMRTRMSTADNKAAEELPNNVGALALAAVCAVSASAIAEISPHAAAFVQLVCLSVWLGSSVYAILVWPVITGINVRDSSEFTALLSKLAPSYLRLSAAMIMSLGTSSVVLGHANDVQLGILGVALAITLYNTVVLEPSAEGALQDELEAQRRSKGKSGKNAGKAEAKLPELQAQTANFLGAEVLLDLLAILCALCYAWDLASSISFS